MLEYFKKCRKIKISKIIKILEMVKYCKKYFKK